MADEATNNSAVAESFQDSTKAVRKGEELDLARLEPYLRGHFPDLGGALTVKQFPSGHSNLTYSVSLGEKEMGSGVRRSAARLNPRMTWDANTTC